jgi:hypothetical protein
MLTIEEAFRLSKGKPIKYLGQELCLVDEFPLNGKSRTLLKIIFEETNSDWRQGIKLKVGGFFEVNDQIIKKDVVLWEDTAPPEVKLICQSETGSLIVTNVWDTGNGVVQSWHGAAAMKIESTNNGRRYYCNDGKLNDDLNNLIFVIENLKTIEFVE